MFWPQVDLCLGGDQPFRQAGEGRGRDRIDGDAIARQFHRSNDGKGRNTRLSGAIVGLTDIAIDARS